MQTIFVESSEFVGQAAVLARAGNCNFITTSIHVREQLLQAGCTATVCEAVAPVSQEELNSVGIENIARVERFVSLVDQALAGTFPEVVSGFQPGIAAGMFGRFKVYFDSAFASYLTLRGYFQQVPGTVAFIAPPDNTGYAAEPRFIGTYIEWPLARYLYPDRVSHIVATPPAGSAAGFLRNAKVKAVEKARHLVKTIAAHRPGPKALVLFYSRDLAMLKDIYPQLGFVYGAGEMAASSPDDAGIATCRARLDAMFSGLERDEEYRSLMRYGEVDLLPVLSSAVRQYYTEYLPGYLVQIPRFMARMKQKRISMMISPHARFDLRHSVAMNCGKMLGIPLVAYQEGGGAGYLDWPMYGVDYRITDHFLAYGAGVNRCELAKGARAHILPVGSVRLAKLRKEWRFQKSAGPVTIMFIVQGLHDRHCHFPYNGGTGQHALEFQLKMFDLFRRFPDVRFIVKTIADDIPVYRRIIGEMGLPNVSLEGRKLTEVMHVADAFLMDFPSTVLLECLMTDRPIAVLYSHGSIKYEPQALAQLEKRAYVSSDESSFAALLEKLIKDAREGNAMTGEGGFALDYCAQEDTEEKLVSFIKGITGK